MKHTVYFAGGPRHGQSIGVPVLEPIMRCYTADLATIKTLDEVFKDPSKSIDPQAGVTEWRYRCMQVKFTYGPNEGQIIYLLDHLHIWPESFEADSRWLESRNPMFAINTDEGLRDALEREARAVFGPTFLQLHNVTREGYHVHGMISYFAAKRRSKPVKIGTVNINATIPSVLVESALKVL